MPYAWGSRHAIADLTGRPPSAVPEAELWMGAHPLGPARLTRDGATTSLLDTITAAPERELGARSLADFGPRLPFLLKVLAAAEPLSLQAHPSASEARAGFDAEERAGIPRDASHRNYKDASHKPELLCALTPFEALCGFRAIDETLALFDALGSAALAPLAPLLAPLRASRDSAGLEATFRALMTLPEAARPTLVDAVVAGTGSLPDRFARERRWTARLAALYPGDVGVVSALLLNTIRLEPGEAVYLGAKNLHAYLEGVGVEIMASSDNVLRGGLTQKHVDVAELARVLDFTAAGPVSIVRPRPIADDEAVYDTAAREFRLSRLRVDPARPLVRTPHGPEILLLTEGALTATPLTATPRPDASAGQPLPIAKGDAIFVPGATRAYELRGDGVVFRATTNVDEA